MKARVKYNNEIIDVIQVGTKTHLYDLNNVEFLDNPQGYWTRLEHQAAIAAIQGLISGGGVGSPQEYADYAADIAHALVEKYKKEERK